MYKNLIKVILPLILALLLASCDPGLDERILIVNETSKDLTFIIEKKGSYNDTTYRFFEYENGNKRKFIGDSIIVVEAIVNRGQSLTILDNGPLGTISIEDKDDGMQWLEMMVDTIYLTDNVLDIDIWDTQNWDLYIDREFMDGTSIFSIDILDEDIN
jgi:hypothetical protein